LLRGSVETWQGHPPKCGVGAILFINHNHSIHIRYAPGGGTNNRVELISLWTLLEAAKENNLSKLQVFGDSKMEIDWSRGNISIQNPNLASTMRENKLNFRAFEWLSFHHILRELNSKANELSKEVLQLQNGDFGFYDFVDGTKTEAMEFRF
jgi:ribonuclease HI